MDHETNSGRRPHEESPPADGNETKIEKIDNATHVRSNDVLTAALAYAELGFKVLPLWGVVNGTCLCSKSAACDRAGKHPRNQHGVTQATDDLNMIRSWFTQWPDSNIGAACGEKSGFEVLDIDGSIGEATLEAAQLLHGELPVTVESVTARGRHLFFRYEGGPKRIGFAPKLDWLSDGAYVVVHPSRHALDGTYGWKPGKAPTEIGLASAPAWLRELSSGRVAASANQTPPEVDPPPGAAAHAVDPTTTNLSRAWRLLRGDHELLIELVKQHLGVSWRVANGYLEGRCPWKKGKCGGDRRGARIFAPAGDGPPLIACRHEDSCNGQLNLFEFIAERLGSRSEAAKAILEAAGLAQESFADLVRAELTLFRTPTGELCARVHINGNSRTLRLDSQEFKDFLAMRHHALYGRMPKNATTTELVALFRGEARFQADVRDVFVRVAYEGDTLYLDLADAQGRVIKITRDGWTVIAAADCPVQFDRASGIQPLPMPERSGSLDPLWALINVPDEAERKLVVAWLLGTLHPTGPYPALFICGRPGSAKSHMTRVLRSIVDPRRPMLRSDPHGVRDIAIWAKHTRILTLDNLSLSTFRHWVSDSLCKLATGAGFGTRSLFTNDDEAIFEASRPVIFNSIDQVVTRSDLNRRCFKINPPEIPEAERRTEGEINAELQRHHPRILGALLDIVVSILARKDAITYPALHRMAEVSAWVIAAEPALGWPPGSYMLAVEESQDESASAALSNDLIAQALEEFMRDKTSWEGKPTELHNLLKLSVPEESRSMLPRTPGQLTSEIARMSADLRTVLGIDCRQPRSKKKGRKWIVTKLAPKVPEVAPRELPPERIAELLRTDRCDSEGTDDEPSQTEDLDEAADHGSD